MKKNKYNTLRADSIVHIAIENLKRNNINAVVVAAKEDAKKEIFKLIPEGAEVMTATSTTLDQMGITSIINDSGKYNSVKSQLLKLNRETDSLLIHKLGAAPEYIIGSVHAVTEDGKVVVASGSGSQLSGYSYGAPHVVFVVSTKKIVKNLDEALERIYSHVLPLEDTRMKQIYGKDSGSNVNKLFILNKELHPLRINLIFVKEDLGF